jgi:Putative DNA-binding domain
MPTFSLPIDMWNETTVQQVVADQHAETLTVEFKKELPFATASDKLEVAKDISAMANGSGGWIIYGIEEKAGPSGLKVAGSAVPLQHGTTAPPDAAHWIGDVIAGNVTPSLRPRIVQFPAAAGGTYVVVRVEPSADYVHMLRDGRYYRRVETAARPMGEREVEQAYAHIHRRKDEAKRYVAGVVAEELIGPPSKGFLIVLVPHAFREVLDPAEVRRDDAALAHLSHHYQDHLSVFEDGVESQFGNVYRLRMRRDGTISFVVPDSEKRWYPTSVLRDILSVLTIARRKWPELGVTEPATLAIRARIDPESKAWTEASDWEPELNALLLGAGAAVDVPVRQNDLHNNPNSIARAVLDRLYQKMGRDRCPLFDREGNMTEEAIKALRSLS